MAARPRTVGMVDAAYAATPGGVVISAEQP
jgi:hypothetical protein